MSYILDALKKAERERHQARIPTLQTVHRKPAPPAPRRLWPWVTLAVVLANAGVVIWLLRPAPTVLTPPPAVPSEQVASSPPAATQQSGSKPMAEQTRRSGPSARPGPTAGTPPQPAPPSSRTSASREPSPDRKPTPAKPSDTKAPAPPVVAALAPKSEPQRAKPADSPVPPTAKAPEQPPLAPTAPAPKPETQTPKPAERSPASLPSFRDLPPAVQASLPAMRLEVLVYSEVPSERLVFINGHKYLEGQWIDGKLVLERITSDGAILSHEGKRFLLRQ